MLAEDFWWECRGFSDDFFRAPVLFFNRRGEPQFRYLREYLESAHRRRGVPLRDEQLWALDTLDAVLELSELQFRCRLAPGEILVIDDLQMFHGRTSFSDFFDAAPYDPALAARGPPRAAAASTGCGSAGVPPESRHPRASRRSSRLGTSASRASWRGGLAAQLDHFATWLQRSALRPRPALRLALCSQRGSSNGAFQRVPVHARLSSRPCGCAELAPDDRDRLSTSFSSV